MNYKVENRDAIYQFILNFSVKPEQLNSYLVNVGSAKLKQGVKLMDVILRPQIRLKHVIPLFPELDEMVSKLDNPDEIVDAVEILIKYSGYIEREKLMADKFKRLNEIKIEGKFDYASIHTISTEARQKLASIQPKTLGQASRIPGVSPSDISVLLVLMGR